MTSWLSAQARHRLIASLFEGAWFRQNRGARAQRGPDAGVQQPARVRACARPVDAELDRAGTLRQVRSQPLHCPRTSAHSWQKHFAVTAALGLTDGSHHQRQVQLDARPTGGQQDHDGHAAPRQVLLVLEVRVGGHEDLEPGLFCSRDQFPVLKLRPASFMCCRDFVAQEYLAQWRRCALVKENLHSGSCQRAPGCVFKHRARLVRRDTWEPLDEVEHRRVVFEVLEQRRDGHPCASKDPSAAHTVGVSFYGRA